MMTENQTSMIPKIWPSSQHEKMTHEFQLRIEDHVLIDYKSGQLLPFTPVGWTVAGLALFLSLAIYFGYWQRGQIAMFIALIIATVALCLGIAAALIKPARRSLQRFLERRLARDGFIGKTVHSTVDANGIHGSVDGVRQSCPWDRIHAIEEDDGTFYFWLSNKHVLLYPARIFASDAETRAFRERIDAWSGHEIASPPVLARMGTKARERLDLDGPDALY